MEALLGPVGPVGRVRHSTLDALQNQSSPAGAGRQSKTLRDRPVVAAERARAALEMLADCRFCARGCGANRLAGEEVPCRAGTEARVFSAQIEVSDELELAPAFCIALSGCNMRCDFCITGAASWNSRAGSGLAPGEMAASAQRALAGGARTVMLLGGEPTIHLPAALEFVAALPAGARLVWKTNGYGSSEARELLEGMFDIWVVDFKFGNDRCAERLARAPAYVLAARQNLLWANGHSRLIVRHLLMPGHLECCWRPVAEWLATELPGVKVSLRCGFWPAWRAARHVELRRTASPDECDGARQVADELELNLVD